MHHTQIGRTVAVAAIAELGGVLVRYGLFCYGHVLCKMWELVVTTCKNGATTLPRMIFLDVRRVTIFS